MPSHSLIRSAEENPGGYPAPLMRLNIEIPHIPHGARRKDCEAVVKT